MVVTLSLTLTLTITPTINLTLTLSLTLTVEVTSLRCICAHEGTSCNGNSDGDSGIKGMAATRLEGTTATATATSAMVGATPMVMEGAKTMPW